MSSRKPRPPWAKVTGNETADSVFRDITRYLKEALTRFTRARDGLVPAPGDDIPDDYVLRADGTWGPP